MKNKEKIGVVIATYNGEKYIEEQIDSILNQSLKPDYIVISDGGSTDNTVAICSKILQDQDIKYDILTSDKQLSVTENFQKGLDRCKTDYIFFSDQDDIWIKNKIEYTMEQFFDSSVCMVFTNASIVDEKLKFKNKNLWNKIKYYTNKEITEYEKNSSTFFNTLIKHNIVTGMCMAITKELKEIAIPFSKYSIHDYWIAFIANNYGNVISANKEEVLYRQHASNVVGTNFSIIRALKKKDKWKDKLQNKIKFIEDINKKNYLLTTEQKYIINRYYSFINERMIFLNKKYGYIWPVSNYKLYKEFYSNPFDIIIRDYIFRLT